MKKFKSKSIAKKTLTDEDSGYVEGTPEERICMVWEISCDTWAFMKGWHAEQRLQRNVATVVRRKR